MDHRFHHLRRSDGELVAFTRKADHPLLQTGHGGIADFDRKVAACDHDGVGSVDDLFQCGDRLCTLDLRHQTRTASGRAQQLPGHVHVFLVLGKRHGNVVGIDGDRGFHVVHVLGSQRRCGKASPLAIDALVVRQDATHLDASMDRVSLHRLDAQPNETIIEKQHSARFHIVRQLLVIQADPMLVAQLAVSVQHERLSSLESHAARGKFADANLRALQVRHDGDFAAQRMCRIAHHARSSLMVGGRPVRKIQSHHVDARSQHARKHVRGAARRSEGGDDLGGSIHGLQS